MGRSPRSYRVARRRGVVAFQQRVRHGCMGDGEGGIGSVGTIERLDRSGGHGQLALTALHVCVSRDRRLHFFIQWRVRLTKPHTQKFGYSSCPPDTI